MRAITTTTDGSHVYDKNSPPGENATHAAGPLPIVVITRQGPEDCRASHVTQTGIVPSSQAAAIIEPLGEKTAECTILEVKSTRVAAHDPSISDQSRIVLS